MNGKPRRFWGTKDMASCMQVMRVLQSYLDGQTDEVTARRVARHLDACRRCGLESSTYTEIKAALARRAGPVDDAALRRLQDFGRSLAPQTGADPTGTGADPGAPPA